METTQYSKFKIHNSKNGFTLFELLVTISLVLIISMTGIAYYSSFNRRQTVEQAAKKIVSDLRLAQNFALSQQKPINCDCVNLNGYKVNFTQSGYRIISDCSPECSENYKEVVWENILLSGLNSVKFIILTQKAEIVGGNSLVVSDVSGNYSKTVVIEDSGVITIN